MPKGDYYRVDPFVSEHLFGQSFASALQRKLNELEKQGWMHVATFERTIARSAETYIISCWEPDEVPQEQNGSAEHIEDLEGSSNEDQ